MDQVFLKVWPCFKPFLSTNFHRYCFAYGSMGLINFGITLLSFLVISFQLPCLISHYTHKKLFFNLFPQALLVLYSTMHFFTHFFHIYTFGQIYEFFLSLDIHLGTYRNETWPNGEIKKEAKGKVIIAISTDTWCGTFWRSLT